MVIVVKVILDVVNKGDSTMEHYQDEWLDTEEFDFDDEVDDAFEM